MLGADSDVKGRYLLCVYGNKEGGLKRKRCKVVIENGGQADRF
jgi:hypothetical protein